MIKSVLFDCSDTVMRFHAKADLAETLGCAERAETIHNAFFRSEIWRKYDNGTVSDDEVKQAVLPLLAEEDRKIAEEYFDGFIRHFTPIEGMEAVLRELKEKGCSLYLVSDFPHVFPYLWDNFDLFRLFDGRAVSFEAKGSKQDLRLFRYVLDTYDLKAEECLFFDDLESLIENAGRCGIRGHVFRGAEDLRNYLKELSVL